MKKKSLFFPRNLFAYEEPKTMEFKFENSKVKIQAENNNFTLEIIRSTNVGADLVLLNKYGTPVFFGWGYIEGKRFGVTTRYITNEETLTLEEIKRMRDTVYAYVMTFFKVQHMGERAFEVFDAKWQTEGNMFAYSRNESLNRMLEQMEIEVLLKDSETRSKARVKAAQTSHPTSKVKQHVEPLWKIAMALNPRYVKTSKRVGYWRRLPHSAEKIWIAPTVVHFVCKEAKRLLGVSENTSADAMIKI